MLCECGKINMSEGKSVNKFRRIASVHNYNTILSFLAETLQLPVFSLL